MIAVAAVLTMAAPTWAQVAAPAKVEVRQAGTARLENVPPIPATVSAEVQRYQNYRAANFQDWLGDGSMLISTRFGATSQLHRVAGPGGDRTQLTFGSEPITSAVALPGGDRFIYARDTGGDEWFQAYARGVGSPAAVQLTEPGTRNQRPVVSKDGKLIAWSQARKGTAENRIFVSDPADPKSARVVFTSDGSMSVSDIAPDGGSLLLSRNISNRASELYRLDLKSGERVRIGKAAEPVRLDDARFTPDGKSVIATTDEGADFRQLTRIDLKTDRKVSLTPGLKWDVESFELSPDGRTFALVTNEDGFSRVEFGDGIKGRRPVSGLPRGVASGLGFSPDGRRLAVGMSTATSPGDVWVVDVASGQATRWTNSELGELAEADLVEPELVRFKSFDGLTVSALVYRPRGAKGPTPVIIDIHGGPEAQTRPSFNPGAQYFVKTLGATVILPNVRGSDGYGKRYLNLDNAEKREDAVKDIGALLDWVKTQPGLDAGRVAVYGQSYGGYMSAAVMTFYSDRLVGGVKRYGITDFRTFLGRTEAYRRDNRRAEYGDERDPEMAKVFARIAPMGNVGKVTKPMLIMQGANDPRVPEAESAQWVAAPRARGIETWYVLFADEGHGFQKKPNNDLRREVETLFLRKVFGLEGQAGGGTVASR